jgi:hypothetical protein
MKRNVGEVVFQRESKFLLTLRLQKIRKIKTKENDQLFVTGVSKPGYSISCNLWLFLYQGVDFANVFARAFFARVFWT